MGDRLTMEQIRARFDAEWVLLANPEFNDCGEVVSGEVVVHSRDRDEVSRRAMELRLKQSARLYIGKTPGKMEFAL